jgi:hormone-sensitive lipase
VVLVSLDGSISRLVFSNDPVLNYQSMRIVAKSYGGSHLMEADSDPFLSPILASDQVLEQFPETVFLVGEADPLLDDATLLFHRLKTVYINFNYILYKLIEGC